MKETFGQRLSRLRTTAGLTQSDIAQKLGITVQAVSKWENDLAAPDISALSDLSTILGVSTDTLLGKDEAAPHVAEKVNIDDLVARVNIISNDNDRVRLNLPIGALGMLANIDGEAGDALKKLDMSKIVDMAKSGILGDLVNITTDDGDIVKIRICHYSDADPEPDENFFRNRKRRPGPDRVPPRPEPEIRELQEPDLEPEPEPHNGPRPEDGPRPEPPHRPHPEDEPRPRPGEPGDRAEIISQIDKGIRELSQKIQQLVDQLCDADDETSAAISSELKGIGHRIKGLNDAKEEAQDQLEDIDDQVEDLVEQLTEGEGDPVEIATQISNLKKKQRDIREKIRSLIEEPTDEDKNQ